MEIFITVEQMCTPFFCTLSISAPVLNCEGSRGHPLRFFYTLNSSQSLVWLLRWPQASFLDWFIVNSVEMQTWKSSRISLKLEFCSHVQFWVQITQKNAVNRVQKEGVIKNLSGFGIKTLKCIGVSVLFRIKAFFISKNLIY